MPMIDPELQKLAQDQMAQETIAVPEEDGVTFSEDAPDEQPDIQALIAIQHEAGDEALTDEEYALVMQQHQVATAAQDHYANLADHVEENELQKIGQMVLDWVEWDEESRSDWYEKEKEGIRLLGVTPNVDGGARFEGASKVVHPLLAEAIVQFSARAMDQLWPAGGPVRTTVLGNSSEERIAQATRVEQFLNYQYTQLMEGAYEQTDNLLIRLPLSGSCFKKSYYDPIDGICSHMVEPADFIVPYRARTLRDAPRYTERMLRAPNDVKKLMVAGLYRNIDLIEPRENHDQSEREIVTDEIDATDGRSETEHSYDDHRHTLLECYCDIDVPGFEDTDEQGKPTGVALPYVVTVDRDSQKVLAIYRNWNTDDPKRKKIIYHTHYRFLPGYGFYGYGLHHWIGGLAKAATGSLRALLDSAQFANMQGGFRSKDAAMPNGDKPIGPGEWAEVDVDAQDLAKAFVPLQYKEPSATLFNLLGAIENMGQRFAGTTEAMVGEGSQNTAVGTMLARIEQGSKVYTGIQKRLHEACKDEFKIIAWLDSVWLPDEYPYAVEGEDRAVFRRDFDSRIDVIPVSDPNYVSNTQRYFMSELVLEMAGKYPHLYDEYEVNRRALESLRVENIDDLLPPQDKKIKRMDPVTENAAARTGKPIQAYMDQQHEAHVAVHQMAMQSLSDDDPAAAALDAHVREHLAMAQLVQMSQATGMPFQMPSEDGQEMPPEIEAQVAMRAAQVAQQMQQQKPPDPEVMEVQAEQERKDQIAAAEQGRKDRESQAEIEREDMETQADIRRENIETQAELERKAREAAANAQESDEPIYRYTGGR